MDNFSTCEEKGKGFCSLCFFCFRFRTAIGVDREGFWRVSLVRLSLLHVLVGPSSPILQSSPFTRCISRGGLVPSIVVALCVLCYLLSLRFGPIEGGGGTFISVAEPDINYQNINSQKERPIDPRETEIDLIPFRSRDKP